MGIYVHSAENRQKNENKYKEMTARVLTPSVSRPFLYCWRHLAIEWSDNAGWQFHSIARLQQITDLDVQMPIGAIVKLFILFLPLKKSGESPKPRPGVTTSTY